MKSNTSTGLAGIIAIASTALSISMAAEQQVAAVESSERTEACVAGCHNVSLLKQISNQIAAEPKKAGEVVKQAIIQSKADAELVLQIVKAAVMAAPEQAEDIRKVALALAPDAKKNVEIMIAAVLKGDQVAGESTEVVHSAKGGIEADSKYTAAHEPEGDQPEQNTVWLTNFGALTDGSSDHNKLISKIQNTSISPNVNHNQGNNTQGGYTPGGSTIVVNPPPTTNTGSYYSDYE